MVIIEPPICKKSSDFRLCMQVTKEVYALRYEIVFCIKKQKDNLSKLLNHLKDIETQCTPGGRAFNINFNTDFKTLILDDEADFASQDTTTGSGTRIHNLLCEIRTVLKQNSKASSILNSWILLS